MPPHRSKNPEGPPSGFFGVWISQRRCNVSENPPAFRQVTCSLFGMSASPRSTEPLSDSERLNLANDALKRYRTSCFWSMNPDFQASLETLPLIMASLRRHGDRAAFQLAARLSR